jgi:hypothetical protein
MTERVQVATHAWLDVPEDFGHPLGEDRNRGHRRRPLPRVVLVHRRSLAAGTKIHSRAEDACPIPTLLELPLVGRVEGVCNGARPERAVLDLHRAKALEIHPIGPVLLIHNRQHAL